MAFYYVRHGQTSWNVEGRFQGNSDIPLNETGIEQAKQTAEALSEIQPVKIYVSPLMRARQTAEIINQTKHCEVIADARLQERGFGTLEGNVCPKDVNLWNGDALPFEGVEELEDFFGRVQDFIREKRAEAQSEDILIVAHGGVYLAFHDYFIGFKPGENRKKHIIPNCQAVSFEVK